MKLLRSLLLLVFPIITYGQNYLEMPVSVQMQNASVVSVFNELENQLAFNFSYEAQLIDNSKKVSLNEQNKALKKVLKKVLGKDYDYKVVGTHVIIQSSLPSLDKRGGRFTYSGQVVGPDNQPVENAIVYEANRQTASITSYDGYYNFNFRDKNHPVALNISHTGFRDTVIYVSPGQTQEVRIIPLPQQRTIPSNFKALEGKSGTALASADLQTMRDIKLVKFMVNDEALYVSNNLNAFNWQSAQVSLLPYVGTNDLMNGLTTNNVSLNVIGGYTAQIEGAEFGAVSNFIQNDVIGFQAAGVSNVVGKNVVGFQAAGVASVILGNLEGAQASGVFNRVKGHHTGAMIAGVANISEGGNNNPSLKGLNSQISGVANVHLNDTTNLQITSVWNQAEQVNGFQISALCNYTKKLNGLQIGIINIADTIENGLPIGLINIVKHGYRVIEFSTNETFRFNAAFKTGGNHFYSFLSAGIDKYISAGYGFGYTSNYKKKTSINFDLSGAGVFDLNAETNSYMGTLYRAQLGLNYRFAKHLSLSVGPAFNFLHAFNDTGSTPPDIISKPGGVYYGQYYLEKSLSSQSNQSWFGWHCSVRF
ncbi:MAG: carboxypeptidase-like regulatory domain-containing protein [Bacteroidales bacterium]|nr:carboxypeptidase-like regulatory domain-containing protein [Bacteroidales bacterium]